MKHQNTSGFSIVLAIGLMLILSFTGLYLLEYMVPFSRNIKGIENASQAFYESYAGVEESVLQVYSGDIGEYHSGGLIGNQVFKYDVIASGKDIPRPEKGNSEYDIAWNRISQSEPISLVIGSNRFGGGSNSINLTVRVPDFDGNGNLDSLKTGKYNDIVFWQISSENDSLSVKNILDISSGNKSVTQNIFSDTGLQLGDASNATGTTGADFYNSECGVGRECVLKISLVNPIISTDNRPLPYLEYQIESSDSIPLSHAYVTSQGKSYGFSKTLEVAIPQQSTNAAFDFTVLQ